ncbi:Putative PKHD-type hydroxylase [Durusdinium trenchii]
MCKLEACHMAEVSSLQARCDRQVSELQRRIDELETEKANQDSLPSPQQPADKPATELEDKDEEEENQKDEQEGPVSISALAAGSFDAVEDVGELQARIHVLETQCSALQRKLNARPIVHANARTPRRPTVKRATGLLGVLREILEQLLRNFTERLLKRDAFLWVFYGHLCVLYVIAASCYAQTGVGSSTVDVDLHAKQALRGATG